jgi:hypothetical protein
MVDRRQYKYKGVEQINLGETRKMVVEFVEDITIGIEEHKFTYLSTAIKSHTHSFFSHLNRVEVDSIVQEVLLAKVGG